MPDKTEAPGGEILRVEGLSMRFTGGAGLFGRRNRSTVRAVDDVDLVVRRGETLGLVGESGCGKTTLGRCILRAHKPTAGRLVYRRADGTEVDLAALSRAELRPLRTEIRTVFQDPNSSLNPRMTVQQIVAEPLIVNNLASGSEVKDRVGEALRRCGLRPELMRRYPHAFSGGERQRIGIARALVTEPRLVVADEAVSALDVSVRSQILNLMEDLQDELGLTYVFISHDLSVIQHLCDRVAVMYLGRIVEEAETEDLFERPRHPYTEALLRSVPRPDPRLRRRDDVLPAGEIASPDQTFTGCRFQPRCRYAVDLCAQVEPTTVPRCHFADELELDGVYTAI
ncbi:ABC transporter ATP-binding protein [Kribbella sp.]|uniref:ABC transporter ATP-binding protein n=1 Tax=Kribbella sp. TaxID=1871183 RepID=UPI002D4D6981|nr:ABC transporter ATP-binding protein [Kribbella sp.]HZX05302.1 ABC transporter ATP-binding protein [Kribbella sp.]